jgi:Family of unknown function (DUF5754)
MVWKKVVNGITFIKSPNKSKKYQAIFKDGTKINFGASKYQHYHDKLGLYVNLNHGDKNRRKLYRLRHGNIYNKDGKKSINNKKSAAWLSWHYLW